MEKENFIPSVELEKIGPEKNVPADVKEKREKRREREDSLSQYIKQWWQGDAHVHSSDSTGRGYGHFEATFNRDEIAEYEKTLGLEFVAFTDHSSNPANPEKLTIDSEISKSLEREAEDVFEFNKKTEGNLMALSGVEANILFDENGEPMIDVPEKILNKLDIVIASRHQIANEKDPQAIKKSLLTAIENPAVDVIGHPDRHTRINNEKSKEYWEKYWEIWPDILKEMEKNSKAFEINLNAPPSKKLVEMAAQSNVKFFINFDAHDFIQYKKELKEKKDVESAKQKWGKGELTEEDKELIHQYKLENLQTGPGVRAILGLVRWLKSLESLGVAPDRVVNSSKGRILKFLTEERGKNTENIKHLQSKE